MWTGMSMHSRRRRRRLKSCWEEFIRGDCAAAQHLEDEREILDELLTKWEEMGYTFHPLSELCEK